MAESSTRDRILEVSLDLFGSRGVDAVSLDEIARVVGVRKQTVLYWFASKDELVEAVLANVSTELVVVIEAAVRAASDDPLAGLPCSASCARSTVSAMNQLVGFGSGPPL
jgi:AcrR family transcriptional regulator